jgi:uncharacterized protein (TIGR02118 family)
MIKLIFMLKRRPGMSRGEFVEYYESTHARLGERYVPNAKRYVRRYLHPLAEPFTGAVKEPDYDVMTELWFDNQAEMDKAMARLGEPDVLAEITRDEEKLFDRPRHRLYIAEEHDSEVG